MQEPRAPVASDNSPPEEVVAEVVMETAPTQLKGILKQSHFYEDEKYQVTTATEPANGMHSRGLGAVNRKDYSTPVIEEECLAIVQTDQEYGLDWGAVFGTSLFRDSPRPSPFPYRRSRSNSPPRTSGGSLPVIERSHLYVQRDKEHDLFTRVEALLRQVQQLEGEGEV